MSPLNFRVDTQSEMKECHIFIAITNKVRSNKMIAIRRRTFIIKVLFFIVSLLSFTRLENDTHIKCSYQNYTISKLIIQANKLHFMKFFNQYHIPNLSVMHNNYNLLVHCELLRQSLILFQLYINYYFFL